MQCLHRRYYSVLKLGWPLSRFFVQQCSTINVLLYYHIVTSSQVEAHFCSNSSPATRYFLFVVSCISVIGHNFTSVFCSVILQVPEIYRAGFDQHYKSVLQRIAFLEVRR